MRTIIVSLITAGLLLAIIFQSNKDTRTELILSTAQAMAQTSPTPQKNQVDKTKLREAFSSPTCSPQPKSLSEEEKNNPLRELRLDDILNSGLGTPDWDCDGICNIADNCIFVYNPDQKDSDGDGKGDACDSDLVDPSFQDSRCDEDGDGAPDEKDNCRLACNPDQKDANKNGIGDVCDQAFPNPILSSQPCPVRRKVKAPKPPPPTKISTSKVSKTSVEGNQSNR